jgi:hypothetical protein
MMATTSPYAAAYDAYWSAGWRGVLPLPERRKTFPPTGYTGYADKWPSYADCHTWASDGIHNIALRLPPDIIGIDVDAYGDKVGGTTLAHLVDKYGPLPPTWLSTSRDDGISGIRLYRIPAGTVLPTKLPGIEFVQFHHRYVVAWPSQHPDTGREYRWIDEHDPTGVDGVVPNPSLLPELPATWLSGLSVEAAQHTKTDLNDTQTAAILLALPPGEPCQHIRSGAGKAVEGGDRHDSYNEAVLAVVGAGRRGCPGAQGVLTRLRQTFIAEVTADRSRTKGEAEAEWSRSLAGAVAIIADEEQGHGCPDDVFAWLADTGALGDITPDTPPTSDTEPTDDDEAAFAYRMAVARKAAELRVVQDAKELNAAADAANNTPLEGIGLADFLAQPDDPVRYRVDDLWQRQGRTLLVAAAKAGKTTILMRNLLGCLTGGGKFLGRFNTQPVDGTVVYLNLEVGEATVRGWLRHAGIPQPEKVVVVNLRGRVGALNLTSTHGRRRFADFLASHNAEIVIADPLAPILAAHGLVEDSNSDVARFFAWWAEALDLAGVQDDLIAHHAGHAGQRSRGASRLLDEPDAIWTITKAQAKVEDDDVLKADDRRFITAYGRDVDLPESGLDFDATTGRLTILDDSPALLRRKSTQDAYEMKVLDVIRGMGGVNISTRDIIKSGGREQELKAALDRLVGAGVILRDDLGNGRPTLHSLISPTVATVSGDSMATVATGGVARPYKGDTHDGPGDGDGLTTPTQLLRSCSNCYRPTVTDPCSSCRNSA